jgi:transposase
MEAYPVEMRKRILADCDAGMNTKSVALKYEVSESWVRRLKHRRRENGEIGARKAGSTPPSKWRPHAEKIAEAVRQRPDATLAELREQLGLSVPTDTRSLSKTTSYGSSLHVRLGWSGSASSTAKLIRRGFAHVPVRQPARP